MSRVEIETLLHQSMGLDAASIGSAAIERAVSRRMTENNIPSLSEYWQHLRSSTDEVQELIERVVVPETWFFRHHESFGALRRYALEEWLRSHPQETLRVLSIPCSTGEEPYSIAMLLLDSGVPAERFSVEAWDISHCALRQAQHGIYGRNSFRGHDLSFRERYFQRTETGYSMTEAVRKQVTFRHENLLEPKHQRGSTRYHVVFCRNVLIYFDRDTQAYALTTIKHLLAPGGLAFVGPAEALFMRGAGFTPIKEPMSFGFKPGSETNVASPGVIPTLKPLIKPSIVKPPVRRVLPYPKTPMVTAPKVAAPTVQERQSNDLEAVRQLADTGNLAAAAQLCEAHLRQQGDSAAAHYLLGLIRSASGDEERAAQNYRKTLYLDPNHAEALIHLALLVERRGDAAEAGRLRERAQRAANKREV